jgi:hypothetical protein
MRRSAVHIGMHYCPLPSKIGFEAPIFATFPKGEGFMYAVQK